MRPKSIVWFERLYLGSQAIGIVNLALARDKLPDAFFSLAAIIIWAIFFGLAVVLGLLVSRRRSRVAKWVLVVILAFGLFGFVPGLLGSGEPVELSWNEWSVWVMQSIAIGLLFTPSARAWLARRPDSESPETLGRTFE